MQLSKESDERANDLQVLLLIDALEPKPILWNNHWVCKVRNVRGIGIGKTPAEAHEDYYLNTKKE